MKRHKCRAPQIRTPAGPRQNLTGGTAGGTLAAGKGAQPQTNRESDARQFSSRTRCVDGCPLSASRAVGGSRRFGGGFSRRTVRPEPSDEGGIRSEEHTSELQSLRHLVC